MAGLDSPTGGPSFCSEKMIWRIVPRSAVAQCPKGLQYIFDFLDCVALPMRCRHAGGRGMQILIDHGVPIEAGSFCLDRQITQSFDERETVHRISPNRGNSSLG